MKACLICGSQQDELAEVCPMCGEGSWGPVALVEDSFVPEYVEPPKPRRGRRKKGEEVS